MPPSSESGAREVDGGGSDGGSDGWVMQNVVQDVGDSVEALCTNKNFDLVAVAGKSGSNRRVSSFAAGRCVSAVFLVMKIYSLRDDEFEQVVDLRGRTRRPHLYLSGSVSWNPINGARSCSTVSRSVEICGSLQKI